MLLVYHRDCLILEADDLVGVQPAEVEHHRASLLPQIETDSLADVVHYLASDAFRELDHAGHLGEGEFLALRRLNHLEERHFGETALLLQHVRGHERRSVVRARVHSLPQSVDVCDQAVELSLAEHKVDEVADSAEQRRNLLRCNGSCPGSLSGRGSSIALLVHPTHLLYNVT